MYGFIGAGEITAAVVEGLSAGVADPPLIYLSPRGRTVGRELAARYPHVRVCADNQEVVDSAPVVVLAVRPPQGRDVLTQLSFRSRQVVLSALAGVPLAQLREWVAPAAEVVRVIPLPQAAQARSLTTVYPDHPVARELFERLGGVVVPESERALNAFTAATSTFATHLDYLRTVADWLAAQGVEAAVATDYVRHIYAQVGGSLSRLTGDLEELTARHMTPGGTNAQLLAHLRQAGFPDVVREGLDQVLTRLEG
jgi:pyrroline-5-carboxylate reductase